MKPSRIALIVMLLTLPASVAAGGTVATDAAQDHRVRPSNATSVDASQRIDVNNISMVVMNTGSFAYDTQIGSAGLEFPKGSGKTAVFAAGLWLGALVGGSVRVSVAEYSDDYRPGAAVGGVPDDGNKPEYKVYKLNRFYLDGTGGVDVTTRDAVLADYNAGAVPHGAPIVTVQPDGSLGIVGDQMLWSVYNDLGKGPTHNSASSALPLGLEVQQTTWAYNRSGPAGSTVFMRFKLVNRGSNNLTGMRVAFWSDPDLGGFADDLVGCDSTLGLGFCYNATNNDAQYGATPPALGFDLLQGPFSTALGTRLPPSALAAYPNGVGPQDSVQTFRSMQGLDFSGNPIIDPSSNPTRFMFAGDPVQGTGWNDPTASDKRMLLSSGPFTMAPGEVQEVVLAVLLAQGVSRLNSVSLLRQHDQAVQTAFDSNSLDLLDAPRGGAARLSLERPWPNPTRGAFSVDFSLPAATGAALELIDIAGRHRFECSLGMQGPGPHTIRLDATSAGLAPGIYFVRIRQPRASVARRLVILP